MDEKQAKSDERLAEAGDDVDEAAKERNEPKGEARGWWARFFGGDDEPDEE